LRHFLRFNLSDNGSLLLSHMPQANSHLIDWLPENRNTTRC